MKRIRILLADDHALIRTGIRNLLSGNKDFEIVGEAADGEEALTLTGKLSPEVLIIDISMPKLSGLEATKQIKEQFPGTGILVLTMHENPEYIYQIFKSGASGYLLKNSGKDELVEAIYAVSKGKKYFGPHVSELMISEYMKKADAREERTGDTPLTKREREILELIGQGKNNQQIADVLFISPRTVDTHRTNIMQKLNIHDAANLVRYALEHGFGSKK